MHYSVALFFQCFRTTWVSFFSSSLWFFVDIDPKNTEGALCLSSEHSVWLCCSAYLAEALYPPKRARSLIMNRYKWFLGVFSSQAKEVGLFVCDGCLTWALCYLQERWQASSLHCCTPGCYCKYKYLATLKTHAKKCIINGTSNYVIKQRAKNLT